MAVKVMFMSYSTHGHTNVGSYSQPFSGVGIEFDPLGSPPDRSGLTLHESGYLPDNCEWNFPSVFSPFWRLLYNSERGHCVLFDDVATELAPSHLVLIPPHRMFHCLGKNPVPASWLVFSFTGKLDAAHSPPVRLRIRETEMCLIQDLRQLIAADETWVPTPAIRGYSLALLQVVLCRPELRWQAATSPNLERARLYIEKHFASALDIPGLASQAGMSVSGFARAFQRCFGTTPGRHVTEVRVREAARMLLHGDATLDAIAEQTGFPDRAYFSRVFKKVTKEAPAGFRKRRHRETAS